jgi:hypothetical protein
MPADSFVGICKCTARPNLCEAAAAPSRHHVRCNARERSKQYRRKLNIKPIKKLLDTIGNSFFLCTFAQIFFDMDTIVKKERQIEIPKSFTSEKVNMLNVQHIQLNIPISFKQVVEIVGQLSPSEKQQLGEVLWDGQNDDDIVIPEEHNQIVRERIKKYENSPENYLSWNDIERKMADRK